MSGCLVSLSLGLCLCVGIHGVLNCFQVLLLYVFIE